MDWTELLNALMKGGTLAVVLSINYRLGIYMRTTDARVGRVEERADQADSRLAVAEARMGLRSVRGRGPTGAGN